INGAGKSSLLRCIAGVQEPTSGSVKLGHLTTLGYFAQEHEQLDLEISGLDNIVNAGVRHLPDARRLLGAFGLSGEKATQVSAALSGGERARLSMAWMAAQEPNVMVLDEPTNNLDIPSVEALITLLAGWNGTLLYVSHDRRFVEGLKPDRVILLPDEEVRHWRPTDIKHVEDR
ncbi:MAG: ABC-F family ATP-binding cassette domain-containing protein, partial [Acidimicrobiia bacterium]|nr:ABC-F family ATP-binding cassette domain-containing protein [Acidimicrobiia bacterium]